MRKKIATNAPQQERKEVEVRRQEWIQACQDAVASREEAKSRAGVNMVEVVVVPFRVAAIAPPQ